MMAKSSGKAAAKKSKANKGDNLNWLAKFSRMQVTVMSIFVLVFAGAGSWLIYRSYAATWYCTAHEYYQYEPGTYHGYCVYNIQRGLQLIAKASGQSSISTGYDGIYGPDTARAVRAFQSWWNVKHRGQPVTFLYVDGVIGSSTWQAFCPVLLRSYNATGGASQSVYNNLSCGGHYGSAPV
jgi:hypothetical protein